MEEERKTNTPRRFSWIRRVMYFMISTTVLFFVSNRVETSVIRDAIFDGYGQICLGASAFISTITIVIASSMPNLLFQANSNGGCKQRVEYSSLYRLALFFSAVLSIAGSFGLLFGGATELMPFLFVFAITAFFFIFSSIELVLAPFATGSDWEVVEIILLAIFGPAVSMVVIDTCIWMFQYGIVLAAAGVVAVLGLFYAAALLWKRINERKSDRSLPPVKYVRNPASTVSYRSKLDLKLDFSRNLKKLREAARRTEESVARKAGLSVGELRKIERCTSNFNMSAAFACLKTLGHHIEVENEEGSVTLYSAGDALSWLGGMVCGLSVEQVASDAGISPTMLGFALDGKIPLSIDVFAGMCSLFRISVKFVRNRQECEKAPRQTT